MFAKKSLGQNFLRSSKVRALMVGVVKTAAEKLAKKPILIEIGPGRGYLTKSLSKIKDSFEKVILIEKDDFLAERLRNMPELEGIEVLNQDFLDYRLSVLKDSQYIVLGSLPYNVSKHIIHSLITAGNPPEYSVFLLQKEVAEDYSAQPPKMKYLSAYSRVYTNSKVLRTVPPKAFNPQPKVHSSVIEFQKKALDGSDELRKSVLRIMKIGFTQPRKTLYNNLKSLYEPDALKNYLAKVLKNEKIRAQELNLDNWIRLSTELTQVQKA